MTILLLIGMTFLLAFVDIFFKSCIENSLTEGESRTLHHGKLILRKMHNKGFAMRKLEDRPETVKYASTFATALLTIYQLATLLGKGSGLKKGGLSLMAAGAWSNTFDRWFRGHVVDYLSVETRWKKVTKLTVNLGDIFIGLGAILVAVSALLPGHKR